MGFVTSRKIPSNKTQEASTELKEYILRARVLTTSLGSNCTKSVTPRKIT